VARECFLSGVDVLLEKPVTGTLDEADSLVALAASRDRIFQVGHVERFNSAFEAAEGAVQSPRLVESLRLSPFPARGIDVDVVLDLMIHDLDILLALVDSRVTEVRAAGLPVLTPLVDVASAWISFANGCAAHLTASRVSEEKVRATRVYQAGGSVTIDFLARKAFLTETKVPGAGDGTQGMRTSELPSTGGDALEREIRSFVACVASRRRPRVSGEDGRRALELAIEIGRRARGTPYPEMASSHG
jgi:predicted dehydrogenase